MKRFIYSSVVGAGAFLLPLLAGAQINFTTTETQFQTGFTTFGRIIGFAIPVIFALGLVIFLWGLLKFLTAAGSEEAAGEGKRLMVWGVVILFVMTAVWGLVGILGQVSGITTTGVAPTTPRIP